MRTSLRNCTVENGYIARKKKPHHLIWRGYDTLVSEFEKGLITKALGETQGVKSKAAQVLNINRTTLIEKMKRLGLD